MTSKNSFSASVRENHKRRVWVWIVSLLVQLALYPGILTVYLSRINFWYEDGVYNDRGLYKLALQNAAADGLGFQPNCVIPVFLLGALIAIQGFSYLYDRKKVDLYHSVPVSGKRRFFVIYANGLLIYLIPNLIALLTGILIAVAGGAMCARVMIECVLGFLVNLFYFLVVYHTAILSVMLTGNVIITLCAFGTFSFIGYFIYGINDVMKQLFFVNNDTFFYEQRHFISIVMEYMDRVNVLKFMEQLTDIERVVLPLLGKWALCAVLLFALAWFSYRKRPAEAAGRAVAFNVIKPFVKVIVSVTLGMLLAYFVYDGTYYNVPVTVAALILGTIFAAGVLEAIFEFDIRAAIRHLPSTGIAAAAALAVFSIYLFDLFGYNEYIPDADQVESVAVLLSTNQNYWEWSKETDTINHFNQSDYLRENMFLTDVEPVCELAKKSRESLVSFQGGSAVWDMLDGRSISVLYRLKSGREVNRCFEIDFADPENEQLLNRIIGTREFREGNYQIVKGEEILAAAGKNLSVTYENGTIVCELPAADAQRLREAWLLDMESFDFSMARKELPCGMIKFGLRGEYVNWTLSVYESFAHTVAYLKEQEAWYPVSLRAEDIERLEVTNNHQSEYDWPGMGQGGVSRYSGSAAQAVEVEPVTVVFDDPEEIAAIVKGIYPTELNAYWVDRWLFDSNYDIEITFKRGTDRPYSGGYFYYRFMDGKMPGFVEERTALSAGGE